MSEGLRASLASKLRWADTELGAKVAVEVRYVGEAAIKNDVKDPSSIRGKAHRGLTQAQPEDVTVRR